MCCRATGQGDTAEDMLQRSLYALEMAWHSHFNPTTANVRMEYQPNLALFRALFAHMQVSLAGCESDCSCRKLCSPTDLRPSSTHIK